MYHKRVSVVWPDVNHLCISVDSSTHSYNDVLLGLGYSHELDQACYPRLQFIVPGKDIYASEDYLTGVVSALVLEGKAERVSAYRQLQAVSHMTAQLARRSLDDYVVPGANLEAVNKDEKRVVVQEHGRNVSYLVNTASRTMRPVLPSNLGEVPLLVMMLDQGSIGAAGSGYVDHLGKMILMKWEKIHRLICDIKGSLKRCCGGSPLKAQVYSSYLWNFQSKPFGSGFFGTVLVRSLNVFALQNTRQSQIFQKYLPRLSFEWGMPCSTEDDEQAIFERACSLRSLRTRGEQSKLGRWFSWNASAKENLDDFSAWKMIIEGSLPSRPDPDDAPITFDDIQAAANAKTPLRALTQMREEGEIFV